MSLTLQTTGALAAFTLFMLAALLSIGHI